MQSSSVLYLGSYKEVGEVGGFNWWRTENQVTSDSRKKKSQNWVPAAYRYLYFLGTSTAVLMDLPVRVLNLNLVLVPFRFSHENCVHTLALTMTPHLAFFRFPGPFAPLSLDGPPI